MAYLSDSEKLRKKKVLKIQRSLQKEEAEHRLDDFSGSDNEEIDFSKEIHPIGYYINDREKMIEQMFSVIKGEKLKKMLPPILKKCSLEEVKADCLVHLLGMSKKRIFAILQGRDLNSSSDSETDSTNSVLGSDSSEEPRITSSTHAKSDVEEIDDTLDISVSKNDLDSLIQDKRATHPVISKKRRDKPNSKDRSKEIKTERSPSLIEISDDEEIIEKKKKHDKKMKKAQKKPLKLKHKHSKEKPKKVESSESSDQSSEKETIEDDKSISDPKKGKSLLEILELEMRARAIRALLEAAPSYVEPAPVEVINIKSEPNDETKKMTVPTDSPDNDNVDESDSVEVVEVINDKNDEDAIVILDDTDEQVNAGTEKKDGSDKPGVSQATTSETDVTWSQRWAKSKGVENVIQNSKICANIRKRMRFARMLKQKQQQQGTQPKDPADPIISELSRVEEGSVEQLELLKSLEEARNKLDEALGTQNLNDSESLAERASPSDNKVIEENGDKCTEQIPECDDKDASSKTTSDVEIIERSVECRIDLTES